MKARKPNPEVDNKNWSILFNTQFNNLQSRNSISDIWINGFSRLGIDNCNVPTTKQLNKISMKYTGWEFIELNSSVILDSASWFEMTSNKRMPLNNFVRTPEELFYCDEPDKWHDIIGHIPFLMIEEYSDMYVDLSKLYFEVQSSDNEESKRLTSFLGSQIIELGLIEEKGIIKAFGATLYSSAGELEAAYKEENQIVFSIEEALKARNYDRSDFQGKYFIIKSIKQISDLIKDIRTSIK